KIPFVFVTGYGSTGAFPAAFAHTPTLTKPYSTDTLRALLKRPGKTAVPLADWCRPRPLDLRRCYTGFGLSVVDHSATSARSRNVTVIWPVAPSILTWPKNCMPAEGGRFCLSSPGALMNFSSGPKVLSSSFGPNVPACSGPETNSQNGSKSWNCALSGL